MDPKQTPPPEPGDLAAERPSGKAKKTARVVCANNNEFWTTQKQFWAWTREGIVTYISDSPLTGKFEGRREKLIIMVNHVLLDESVPDHRDSVLKAYDYKKVRKPQYPKRPVYKRSR
jgi:hypothetical protein